MGLISRGSDWEIGNTYDVDSASRRNWNKSQEIWSTSTAKWESGATWEYGTII